MTDRNRGRTLGEGILADRDRIIADRVRFGTVAVDVEEAQLFGSGERHPADGLGDLARLAERHRVVVAHGVGDIGDPAFVAVRADRDGVRLVGDRSGAERD